MSRPRLATLLVLTLTQALALVVGQETAQANANPKESHVMESDNRQRGAEILARLDPQAQDKLRASLGEIAPEMERFVVEFGYGQVLADPGLGLRERQVATVAALTALGNAHDQLKFHINGALAVGLSPEELVEVIYVTTVFAGFPAGLNALGAAREVFKARGATLNPASGQPAAHPETGPESRRERGLRALETTSRGAGQAVVDSLADIAPEMAGFILDFSYGDIISRPGLSPRLKEIAMIAAATARGTMRPQLVVHIRAGLNVGLSRREIVLVIEQMAVYAGFPAALNGLAAAREAFGP